MSMFYKIAGKVVTYLGLLHAINGLINNCYASIAGGVLCIITGCLVHELNEK